MSYYVYVYDRKGELVKKIGPLESGRAADSLACSFALKEEIGNVRIEAINGWSGY